MLCFRLRRTGGINSDPVALFELDLTGELDEDCTNPKGPTRPWTPVFLCWYLEYLEGLANPNRRWISTYHLFRSVPQDQWPPCLWYYWTELEECGLKTLLELELEFRSVSRSHKETIANLTSGIEEASEEERRQKNIQIRQLHKSRAIELSGVVANQSLVLEESECFSEIYQVWSSVYLLLLKDVSSDLGPEEINYLASIVELCPADYGNPVHWAKGLLAPYLIDFAIADENCGADIEIIEREKEVGLNSFVKLFPNPVSDWLSIETHGTEKSYNFEIKNLSGHLMYKGEISTLTKQIDISTYPTGVYLLSYHNENINSTEKFIKIE